MGPAFRMAGELLGIGRAGVGQAQNVPSGCSISTRLDLRSSLKSEKSVS